jgi:hypothetical protein
MVRRKTLSKQTRLALAGILATSLIFTCFFAYTAFKTPTSYERDVALCKYKHSANFNHLVYLKPNSLYNESVITGKKLYFTRITDYVYITFSYTFNIDKPADVSTECDVIAEISTDTWSKKYFLDHISSDSKLSLRNPIDLSYYMKEIEKIEKEIGVFSRESKLKLIYNIHTQAKTEYGKIDERFAPMLTISLGNTFSISESLTKKAGSISGKEVVKREDVIRSRIFASSISGTIALGLVTFALLTKSREDADLKIKRYEKWIISIEKIPSGDFLPVGSFDDLIKVAGELGKPICKKDDAYYVIDAVIYEWRHSKFE